MILKAVMKMEFVFDSKSTLPCSNVAKSLPVFEDIT